MSPDWQRHTTPVAARSEPDGASGHGRARRECVAAPGDAWLAGHSVRPVAEVAALALFGQLPAQSMHSVLDGFELRRLPASASCAAWTALCPPSRLAEESPSAVQCPFGRAPGLCSGPLPCGVQETVAGCRSDRRASRPRVALAQMVASRYVRLATAMMAKLGGMRGAR